jgi:hypothetical protein
MAEFEQTCKELDIPLIVLPPSKPTYNGGVERGNRIFRGFVRQRGGNLLRHPSLFFNVGPLK